MKLDQLRKVIREEIKSAIKEELQDILNEAVAIASAPDVNQMKKVEKPKPSNLKWSTPSTGQASLDEMLLATQKQMTSEDFRSIGNLDSSAVNKPNFASSMANQMGMQQGGGNAGISFNDIPGFDPAKAKAILEASNKKDKIRAGA